MAKAALITLNIGDIVASREPVILGTILGSCVSVCLYDEESKIGGMNHFLVPDVIRDIRNPLYCGPNSIKRLIDGILGIGARAENIRAKIFGGGRVVREFTADFDIGRRNVKVAKEMLSDYGIPIINEFICQDCGIKLIFHTASGKAFARQLQGYDMPSYSKKYASSEILSEN